MLDEQATQILGTTDAIAERVLKTGGTTLRSIGAAWNAIPTTSLAALR